MSHTIFTFHPKFIVYHQFSAPLSKFPTILLSCGVGWVRETWNSATFIFISYGHTHMIRVCNDFSAAHLFLNNQSKNTHHLHGLSAYTATYWHTKWFLSSQHHTVLTKTTWEPDSSPRTFLISPPISRKGTHTTYFSLVFLTSLLVQMRDCFYLIL